MISTKTKLRLFAVEDEQIHQLNLQILSEQLGYDLIDVVEDPFVALERIKEEKPDLLLLDVRLDAEEDGIQLAQRVNDIEPIPMIFVTSDQNDETFERAKEVRPSAFLKKPIDAPALRNAIELAVRNFKADQERLAAENTSKSTLTDSFYIKIGNKLRKIRLEDIDYVEVQEKFCSLVIAQREIHIKMPLKDLLQKLPEESFAQVHRSFVVNINKMDSINLSDNEIVCGDQTIPVSRSYKERFLERIQML